MLTQYYAPDGRPRVKPSAGAVIDSRLFVMIYQQNCENARHIKNERIWFMNLYSIIAAGILSLLNSYHGQAVLECSLTIFMVLFSLIGLLTSFRLKVELEECLQKLHSMASVEQLEAYAALGESEGKLIHYPKFRWVFPVFYSLTSTAFLGLLAYRFLTGRLGGFGP